MLRGVGKVSPPPPPPVHQYSVNIFHILVLQGYGDLKESRLLLKSVLWSVRIVALSISFIKRLNKTEFAVFLYCTFSISEGSAFLDYL